MYRPIWPGTYYFNTFTFTTMGNSGNRGPTPDQTYVNPPWPSSYFSIKNGQQNWTVPANGVYQITAAGAYGATPGRVVTGQVTLYEGQVLTMLVGQQPTPLTANVADNVTVGGGGGTFVTTNGIPLIVASGGDGSGSTPRPGSFTYVTSLPVLTGGQVSLVNGYNVHAFKNVGRNIMTVSGAPITVQILIVAGGGGAGWSNAGDSGGGGGGGGGVYYTSSYTLEIGTYTVNVGAGGSYFQNGNNSNIYNLGTLVLYEVPGGGAGALSEPNGVGNGSVGGSGGGGSNDSFDPQEGLGGAGIPPFGNNGGNCYVRNNGGGGGGAGTPGGDAITTVRGAGGDGLPCSITGSVVYYGAGGNGYYQSFPGGGAGLGGNGPNSGGGGSGQGNDPNYQPGASGIIIISEAPAS
jgi:hypothetical protein